MGTPSDGFTDIEKDLKTELENQSLLTIYAKLPTSRMKFVVAAHFELGYSQELISKMLGIKQPSLQDEIKHIRRVLKGDPYKPHKHKGTVKVSDMLAIMQLLAKPWLQ